MAEVEGGWRWAEESWVRGRGVLLGCRGKGWMNVVGGAWEG